MGKTRKAAVEITSAGQIARVIEKAEGVHNWQHYQRATLGLEVLGAQQTSQVLNTNYFVVVDASTEKHRGAIQLSVDHLS